MNWVKTVAWCLAVCTIGMLVGAEYLSFLDEDNYEQEDDFPNGPNTNINNNNDPA